jgi:streptomycin 6-kinase
MECRRMAPADPSQTDPVSFDGIPPELRGRVVPLLARWQVDVDSIRVTPGAVLAFGRRGSEGVVVRVTRTRGDEWCSGEVLWAFAGRGTVRVYDTAEGASLLERLDPGEPLADSALDDEVSMNVIAATMAAMSPNATELPLPTAAHWGKAFARYRESGDPQVSAGLVEAAEAVYLRLCETQSRVRLLHGDLHHGNVVCDRRRGWVAIDPKGVFGEAEYEVGAALRNPWGRPDVFANPVVIERRVAILSRTLRCDEERLLSWGFAQAVLSVLWNIEDGVRVDAGDGCLALARAVRKMLQPL